jgi:hypothetical protein
MINVIKKYSFIKSLYPCRKTDVNTSRKRQKDNNLKNI